MVLDLQNCYRMLRFVFLLGSLLLPVYGYTPEELQQMFSLGLQDIKRETINGPVTLEQGKIPEWLAGNFMRHSCGVLGETQTRNPDFPNYIFHLFDCFEIGQKFRIENGEVTFTNKWFDTTVNDIFNVYDRNMNESSMFVPGTFSKVNKNRTDEWERNLTDNKVSEVPHVSWWKVGEDAVAMTETPIGVVVDPETVTHKGEIQYDDNNFGIPKDDPSYMLTNNPAHEHTEPDGTLWSTVSAIKFVSQTQMNIWRIVYKVGADRKRKVVGEYHYADADLAKCGAGQKYPDYNARFGYMHSFCMTSNYVILPETGYMHDPCFAARYDKYEPFFPQGYSFEEAGFTRLLVMRKSDGQFIANITLPPFFVTHQFGSYEDGELIHMDMLTYDDATIYTEYTFTDHLMSLNNDYTTNITRITINTTDWTASMRNLRRADKSPAPFEMSNINYAYNGLKYTYGYAARNFDMKEQNAITKFNMDTGEELEYLFPEGMFVQEPQFIASPGAVAEDDGVILAQGFDGRKQKAFMVVIDAVNMELIGHVTATDIALFGLHNRFYPLPAAGNVNRAASTHTAIWTALTIALFSIVISQRK